MGEATGGLEGERKSRQHSGANTVPFEKLSNGPDFQSRGRHDSVGLSSIRESSKRPSTCSDAERYGPRAEADQTILFDQHIDFMNVDARVVDDWKRCGKTEQISQTFARSEGVSERRNPDAERANGWTGGGRRESPMSRASSGNSAHQVLPLGLRAPKLSAQRGIDFILPAPATANPERYAAGHGQVPR
jgi:hypothetical protein